MTATLRNADLAATPLLSAAARRFDLPTLEHVLRALAPRLLPALAIVLALAALLALLRRRERRLLAEQGRTFRLRLPAELERERLAQVLGALADAVRRSRRSSLVARYLGLELRVEAGRVEPLLFCSGGLPAEQLAEMLLEAFPGARIEPAQEPRRPTTTRALAFRPTSREQLPLRTEFAADPAPLTLRALAATTAGEGGTVQLLFAPAPASASTRLRTHAAALRSARPRRSPAEHAIEAALALLRAPLELFEPTAARPQRPERPSATPWQSERARALDAKAAEPLFACSVRVAAWAHDSTRARLLLNQLAASFAQFRGLGGLRTARERAIHKRLQRRLPPPRPPLLLSTSELAALVPFPERPPEAAVAFEPAPARELAADADAPRQGLLLGHSHARGRSDPLYIAPEALLQHAHLLGPTGSGKSTLLLSLAVQAAEQGYGLALLEPKGDLAAEFLRRLPKQRLGDVVLLDFGDRTHPPACNLLAGAGERGQVEAVGEIFSRLFSAHWGPRSDDLLRAALATLAGGRDDGQVPTLADVLPLLTDPRKRARYQISERVVLAGFWRAWEQQSEASRQQALAPLANKLRAFLLREPLRDALVQPEAPDLLSVIRQGKVLVCSLPKSALWEDGAALLGSVLLHRLWQAAQALGPARGRRPLLCFVDEFHSFSALPGGMADTLAEARGYGLGFLLAHQQLAQLTPELREAVAVNCRTKLCFQLDPPDHERMARHFAPRLDANDLLRLDAYQLAARILDAGRPIPATTATALPAHTTPDDDTAAAIRTRTHEHARTKHDVEQLIRLRFPEIKQAAHGAEVAADETGAHGRALHSTFGRRPNALAASAENRTATRDAPVPENSDRSSIQPDLKA